MELNPPRTLPGGDSTFAHTGYERVASSDFASGVATCGLQSLPPFPVHRPEFDLRFPPGTIDPAFLSVKPATYLASDPQLNRSNTYGLPDTPLSSNDIAYLTTYNPTETLTEQLQQPEVSVHGQIMAPSGLGGQYLLDYAPEYNTTALGALPLGAHSSFVGYGSFDIQEFQNDITSLNCTNGSLTTAQNAPLRASARSTKRQHHHTIRPTPRSHTPGRPVRDSPIHRRRTLSPRVRAITRTRSNKVSPAGGVNDASNLYSALSPFPSPSDTPLFDEYPELTGTPPELVDAPQPSVSSSTANRVPTTVPNVSEPAVPAMIPIQVYGHLSKEHWTFFRTSKIVLDQITGRPGGKQVHACQYIDPTTKMRCYHMKCHGPDGKPLVGKGFPIKDLEDYLRHLWMHRKLERMLSSNVNSAIMTVWDDAVLDAQKALDDAKGIVYPYSP
ncbi:hypothetical protein FRC06_001807 [Ceratobasidium sp. 370]|nr:hypothetical protein FRC06_001807 [Ceratobasidium sp. 370]